MSFRRSCLDFEKKWAMNWSFSSTSICLVCIAWHQPCLAYSNSLMILGYSTSIDGPNLFKSCTYLSLLHIPKGDICFSFETFESYLICPVAWISVCIWSLILLFCSPLQKIVCTHYAQPQNKMTFIICDYLTKLPLLWAEDDIFSFLDSCAWCDRLKCLLVIISKSFGKGEVCKIKT